MSASLASEIKFKELCKVLEEIVKTRVEKKKTEILIQFIKRCRAKLKKFPNMDRSFFPIMRLILPRLEREREAHNLREKSLAVLYTRVFCLGKVHSDVLKEYKTPSAKNTGNDFAEKASNLLRNRLPCESSEYTIEQINLFFDNISFYSKTRQKEDFFTILIGRINALEFKWITRILVKDLRLGIATEKILRVLHPDANSLFQVSSNLRHVCDTLHNPKLRHHQGIQVFTPFKPMLLERSKIENARKLFRNGEIYIVQCKYDGERSQMHMKDGKYKYFTRRGFDITSKPGYGESDSLGFMSSVFARLLKPQVKSIILDGELMGWHKGNKVLGTKAMNFDVKTLTASSYHQPCFVAFDIIMYNDNLLIDEPYEKRLQVLREVLEEEEGCLLLDKSIKISNPDELLKIFNECLAKKEEGIVLKKCDSKYKLNAREGTGCYKMKAEYSPDLVEDLDLIILGGYYGDGRFMGLMKSFLMGVASMPNILGEYPTEFVSVVSVSNGFAMETLKELWKMFENKWEKKCPKNVIPPKRDLPNLWLRPENSIILTVRATEMVQSNDYPNGYSLRFPRVLNVRIDKPWFSACTDVELKSLIKDSRPIQKLTKREANYEDVEEASEFKVPEVPKRMKRSPVVIEKKPPSRGLQYTSKGPVNLTGRLNIITRLFDGKEICVVNGDVEFPKHKIETILEQHKAKIVQNPSKDTYCVIVTDDTRPRASYIVKCKQYDVVTTEWFKRVTKEENWSSLKDFLPWELKSSRESTKSRLAQYYDDYYDHYTEDADEETLLRTFKRIDEMDVEYEKRSLEEMERELFGETLPYSLFRGIVAYFNDQSDLTKKEFRFMSGTVKDSIDEFVTHVFMNTNFELQDLIDIKSQTSATIIKNEWIKECFKQNAVIPYSDYLVD